MTPWLECVPNVSEGRDRALVTALGEAVQAAGARLLDVHSDVDHHRSVFTYMGPADVVERATLALGRLAVARIDLRTHRGVHPRVGAVDVVPFVPLRGAAMRDAVAAAHRVGRAFAAETGVPVFLYGEAALSPLRRELPEVRRGGLEALVERMRHRGWRPDAGPATPHPTAGVSVVGARRPLIAFNAMLDSTDLDLARAVAAAVRESSGGLPAVRALGIALPSRGLVQVSMNLLDHHRTPPGAVARRIEAEVHRRGTRVREYELVGCAPADAFAGWDTALAPIAGLAPTQLLEPELFVAAA